MDDNTTLIDLQSEIFSYIPRALASLDREENMTCNAHCVKFEQVNKQSANNMQEDGHHDLNAMYGRQQHFPQQQRPQQQQRFQQQPRSGYSRNQQSKPAQRTQKFCKICQALELPPNVVQSHYPSECKKKAMLQEMNMESPNLSEPDNFQYYDEDHTHNTGYQD